MNDDYVVGPRGLPFISHIRTMLRLTSDPLPVLRDHYARYGRISGATRYKKGKFGVLMAFGAAYNQPVLSDPATYHSPTAESMRDGALKRLASGLVNMNGERHKSQRRLMMPAFHRQAVAGYHGIMADASADLLRKWQASGTTALIPDLRALVLRIVSLSLFGIEDNAVSTDIGAKLTAWVRMANTPRYQFVPGFRGQLKHASEAMERDLLGLIAARRTSPGGDVLSLLIAAHDEDGGKLTDAELLGHLAVLFIAGHETTVNALAWTLVFLARDPVLRLALTDEITGITGGGVPTVEQAMAMPLLDRVIKESMRLLPALALTLRVTPEPTELAGVPLIKDGVVILSHYITHRLPEIFPEPDKFKPQRWETADPSPYAYMPFSAGPRLCIGAAFASLEMRVVLAMLIPAVQITPLGSVDVASNANLLQPKGDLPVKIDAAGKRLAAWPVRGTLGLHVE